MSSKYPHLPKRTDHPRLRNRPGDMTAAEIRFWIRELREKHGWRLNCLSRTLGFGPNGIHCKLTGTWIFPGEQPRFSRQLDRILSGELVQMQFGQRFDAVLADNPVPLRNQHVMRYDIKAGRISWMQPRLRPDPVLPSFANGLKAFTEG